MNLYNYVKQCLSTEMKFVQGAGNANIAQSTATAEVCLVHTFYFIIV